MVSDWIAPNAVHVLADFVEREPLDITWDHDLSPLDYDVCACRAHKMQAEPIAAVSRTIGTAIRQIVSKFIDSLRGHWRTRRQIEQLSRVSPRLLDDASIPRETQVRLRIRQTHSQCHRVFFTSKFSLTLRATHSRHSKTNAITLLSVENYICGVF